MQKPFPQSFWVVPELLCAGQYPGASRADERDEKLGGLLDCGITQIVRLMETDEVAYGGQPFAPYAPRFLELAAARDLIAEVHTFPIRDGYKPSPETLAAVLEQLQRNIEAKTPTYLHCWGGHGRTGTIVACHLIRNGSTPEAAIAQLMQWRADLPKNHFPFENDQENFVRAFMP